MPARHCYPDDFTAPRTIEEQLAGTMFARTVAPALRPDARPTSRRAARVAAPRAPSKALRGLAAVAATATGLTPDEAADRASTPESRIDHLAMRPRFTQMRQAGWLEGTGLERPSTHGSTQEVLRITPTGQKQLGGSCGPL
jgi:hypothetical protein